MANVLDRAIKSSGNGLDLGVGGTLDLMSALRAKVAWSHWAATVVMAAPATPRPSSPINNKSPSRLTIEVMITILNGSLEFF